MLEDFPDKPAPLLVPIAEPADNSGDEGKEACNGDRGSDKGNIVLT